MVFPVQTVPADAGKPLLPFAHNPDQIGKPEPVLRIFAIRPMIDGHVLKLKHHIQFRTRRVGVPCRLLHCGVGRFSNRHDIVPGQNLTVHFLKIFMYTGAVLAVRRQVSIFPVGSRHLTVWKSLILRNQADDIHAKAIHSFFQPPGHHVVNLPTHLRVFPIQIRLLF